MQNVNKQLRGGAAWIAATRAGVNLIGFASTIILARLLTPADFGLVAIATTVSTIIASFTELSLTSALVQHSEADDSLFDAAFTLNMLRAAVVGVVTAALAWPIAWFYGDNRLIAVIIVIATGNVFAAANSPKLVVLTRKLIFKQEFAVNVGAKLAGIIAAATVAFVFRSYWALAIGTFASQAATTVISHLIAPHRPRFNLDRWRELLGFSIWVTLSEIINTLNWRMDQIFLGAFLGKTTVGQYAFANNVSMIATRELTNPLTQTLFPAFSRMNGEIDRLRAAYIRAQTLISCISMPLGVGFALVAADVIPFAVGAKWQGAVPIIQALCTLMAVQTLAAPYRALAMAVGRMELQVRRDFGSLIVRFPLAIGGLFFFGLSGFLGGRMIAAAINIFLSMTVVRRICGIGVRQQVLHNWRTLGAMAAMAVAVFGLRLIGIGHLPAIARAAIEIAIGSIVYGSTLMALWLAAGRPAAASEAMLVKAAQGVLAKVRLAPHPA